MQTISEPEDVSRRRRRLATTINLIPTNGDFSGGLAAPWGTVTQAGTNGNWVAYSGAAGPISGVPIASPASPPLAVVADMVSLGSPAPCPSSEPY